MAVMSWRDSITEEEGQQTTDWRASIQAEPENSNEQAFDGKERFFLKNVMRTPQRIQKYLQQKNPELETKILGDEVYVALDGKWKPIDPQGLDWQDVTDVIGDVGFGMLEDVPKAAGAAVGFASPIPGGTLAGAMIGGGLGAAASEYAQQKIASNWVDDAENMEDVAVAGTIGAVMPSMFGHAVDPTVKYLASKYAKKGATNKLAQISTEEGLKAANKAGQGIPRKVWSVLRPDTSLEAIAGINKGSMAAYEKWRDFVNKTPMQEVLNTLDRFNREAQAAGRNAERNAAEDYQMMLRALGESTRFDLEPVKKAFRDQLGDPNDYLENEFRSDLQKAAEANFISHFRKANPVEVVPDPQMAFNLGPNPGVEVLETSQAVYDPARGIYNRPTARVVDGQSTVFRFPAPEKKFEELKEASPMELWNFQKELNLGARPDEKLSPAVNDRISGMQRAAAAKISELLDNATGGQSSVKKAAMATAKKDSEEIASKFNRRQGTFSTLANLDSNRNSLTKEALLRAGFDPQDFADKFKAFNSFKDPSQFPLSGGGATSTSRTSVLMPVANEASAALFGEGNGIAKSASGYVMNRMVSPAGLKRYLDAAHWFDSNIADSIANQAAQIGTRKYIDKESK